MLLHLADKFSRNNPRVKAVHGGDPLPGEKYQLALLRSKFTLSPGGHNAECFRTWEALEAG